MKKRLLIGILTVGMVLQSLAMPVMAAPMGSVNNESSEINVLETQEEQSDELSENRSDTGIEGLTGGSTGDQEGGSPDGNSGDEGQEKEQPEGTPDKGQESEQPEGTPDEGQEEERPEGTPDEGREEKRPEGTPDEGQEGEQPEGTPDEEQEEEQSGEMLYGDPDDKTDSQQAAELKSEYVDISEGVYQEGSFTVFGENEEVSPYSVMPILAESIEKEMAEYIYQQLLEKKAEFNFSTYGIKQSDIDDLAAVYSGVMNDHPELYYVKGGFSYSYSTSTTVVTKIRPVYINGLDDQAFQKGLRDALAVVLPGMTDLEKAIVLHDYIVVNCEYDYDNYLANKIPDTSYSTYGVFANRIAVCQGYALAYKLLLNTVGINCYMVTSDAMNHAWNLIELDGEYYQVDSTWDDPTWDLIGRAVHTYMFRSDDAFVTKLRHYGWEVTSGSQVVDYKATDTLYDSAFWVDCNSPLVLTEDGCYYTYYDKNNYSAGIKRKESLTDITDNGTTIQNIEMWRTWDDPNSIWLGVYSGLFMLDGRLYYNDMSYIYSIDPDGTNPVIEFAANTSNGYIYGSALCQGKVLYSLHQKPGLLEREKVLEAGIYETIITVQPPRVTTYKVGQEINLEGGKMTRVSGNETKTFDLEPEMISGFDSTKPGICKVTVTGDDGRHSASFDTLIVAEPALTARLGETLSEITDTFPTNGYGEYSWKDGTQKLDTTGEHTFGAVFIPNDEDTFQKLDLEIKVTVAVALDGNTEVTFKNSTFTYNGTEQEPKVVVSVSDSVLEEERDYTLSYQNNINAGEATVTINGKGDCSGSIVRTFTIDPAEITIRAKDKWISTRDPVPQTSEYEYEMSGLLPGDTLAVKPSFTCDIGSTAEAGEYDIIPGNASAGKNYKIIYKNGKLTVEGIIYTVSFDLGSRGEINPVKAGAGSLIREPAAPEAEGYLFDGWYKDTTFAAKQKWNFATDTVLTDTTLYACWIKKADKADNGLQFSVQDIQNQYYTGSAIKPTVYVYAADGKTLLKSGKDYTIKYVKNTDAVKVLEDGETPEDEGGTAYAATIVNAEGKNETQIKSFDNTFSDSLPHVVITGKGNYQGTIYKNFTILPAKIAADNENAAPGFTLKYSDQLVMNPKKDQNPFSSLKYKKGMTLGKDYMITLTAGKDVTYDAGIITEKIDDPSQWHKETIPDASGKKYIAPVIPKGYYGTFTMTVTGKGNYTGSFTKTVYVVVDKDKLMKNATISLGKNQKSKNYNDRDSNGEVKLDSGYMRENPDTRAKEYYRKVGEEEILLPNANEIFLVSVKDGKTTNYLREDLGDFSVTYTNHKAVGTATMTITGNPERGYYGSKSVTFKITGTAFNTRNVDVKTYDAKNNPEETAGCFMPSIEYTGKAITQNSVTLTKKETGETLAYGTHYTISYKNNVKKGTATVTFTAKPESGYTGSFKKTFKITAQSLSDGMINENTINKILDSTDNGQPPTTWPELKDAVPYVRGGVKPSDQVVLTNGEGSLLTEGTDYTVSYRNNTAIYASEEKGATNAKRPYMTVSGKGNYMGSLKIFFDIEKAELSEDDITVSQIAWNQKAKDTYEYKPGVKVVDGVSNKTLSKGKNKDYDVEYRYNKQENVSPFMTEGGIQPVAVITVPAGSSYILEKGKKEIVVPLSIYETKLTASNLYIIVSDTGYEATYKGNQEQVTPGVTVYYSNNAKAIKNAKNKKETNETLLTKKIDDGGEYELTKLGEMTEVSGLETDGMSAMGGAYTVTYGANNTAGNNKGSVTITGVPKDFGASVTVRFKIQQRGIYIAPRVSD